MDRREEVSAPQLPDHSFFYKNVLQKKKAEARRDAMLQHQDLLLLLMELPTLLTFFSYAALNIFFFLSKSGFQELQISKILLSSILLSFLFFSFFLYPNLCRTGSLPLTLPWFARVNLV